MSDKKKYSGIMNHVKLYRPGHLHYGTNIALNSIYWIQRGSKISKNHAKLLTDYFDNQTELSPFKFIPALKVQYVIEKTKISYQTLRRFNLYQDYSETTLQKMKQLQQEISDAWKKRRP